MTMPVNRPRSLVLWPAVVAILGGCSGGPELMEVSGRVTVAGEGVGPGFIVSFVSDQGGRPSQAVTDVDGRYRLKFTERLAGAVPGQYRVIVSWPYADGEGPANPNRSRLPAAAESIGDTPFRVDVRSATSFDIDLADAEGRP